MRFLFPAWIYCSTRPERECLPWTRCRHLRCAASSPEGSVMKKEDDEWRFPFYRAHPDDKFRNRDCQRVGWNDCQNCPYMFASSYEARVRNRALCKRRRPGQSSLVLSKWNCVVG